MKTAIAIDLETTSVDLLTTGIVQYAGLPIALPSWGIGEVWETLAYPGVPIPHGASEVHGIYDRDVEGLPHITAHRDEIVRQVTSADLVVSFNGAAFDLPILSRIFPGLRFPPHFDVIRAWTAARGDNLFTAHPSANGDSPGAGHFRGSLGAAHAWLTGREPQDAHHAGVDCQMTAEVGQALASHYGLAQCVEWTTGPLPGFADYAGKIDSEGCLTFGKHKGANLASLRRTDRGYLAWLLRSDFHAGTKEIVRKVLDTGRVS